jgi:hypothetical protein
MSKMRYKNILYCIVMASYVQNRKVYHSLVTMLQDETKLCNSTTVLSWQNVPTNVITENCIYAQKMAVSKTR